MHAFPFKDADSGLCVFLQVVLRLNLHSLSSLCVCRRRSGVWGLTAQLLCPSPAALTGASMLSPTLLTLTCSERMTNRHFLKTSLSMRWITTWGQRTSGESGPSALANWWIRFIGHCFFSNIYPCNWKNVNTFNETKLAFRAISKKKKYIRKWWIQGETNRRFEHHTHIAAVWMKAVEWGCETQRVVWVMDGGKCLSGDEEASSYLLILKPAGDHWRRLYPFCSSLHRARWRTRAVHRAVQ